MEETTKALENKDQAEPVQDLSIHSPEDYPKIQFYKPFSVSTSLDHVN